MAVKNQLTIVEKRVLKVLYLVEINREALKVFNIGFDTLQELADQGYVNYQSENGGFPKWELTQLGIEWCENHGNLTS